MKRRQTLGAIVLGVIGTVLLLWSIGFVWFLGAISQAGDLPAHADGILALTGGAERVETALRLLAEGRADRLLISGTGAGTELRTLGHRAGIDTSQLADRVTLGRLAASTRGNAAEAAAWVRATHTTSLIVVTGYYHMPRTLEELARVVRGVALHPFPVGGDQRHRVAMRLLLEEYSKYLLSLAGISAWLPQREPPRGVDVS